MNKTPNISVAVLNWNGKRFIDPFFNSLLKQSYPLSNIEIIFIDNGSSDDSVEYLKNKFSDKLKIKIVKNKKNYGYAKGNNLGLKHATGDYILVVNNDIVMHRDLIAKLVNRALKTKADATVPKLMFLNKNRKINNAGSILRPDNTWPVLERGYDEQDSGQYEVADKITAFCGACVLFSRNFLCTVGLYDSKFFMYFEDSDLSWRGQRYCKTYYYEPKAIAYHVHTGSSKEGSPLFNFYVSRNRVLILAKNAKLRVFMKGYAETIHVQFLYKVYLLLKSLVKRKSIKHSLVDLLRGQKSLLSLHIYLPYVFAKRWGMLKEEKL